MSSSEASLSYAASLRKGLTTFNEPTPLKLFKASTLLDAEHPNPDLIAKVISDSFSSLHMLTVYNNTLSAAFTSKEDLSSLFNFTFKINDFTFSFTQPLPATRVKLFGLPFGITKQLLSNVLNTISPHVVMLDTYKDTKVLNGNATAWLRLKPGQQIPPYVVVLNKKVTIKSSITGVIPSASEGITASSTAVNSSPPIVNSTTSSEVNSTPSAEYRSTLLPEDNSTPLPVGNSTPLLEGNSVPLPEENSVPPPVDNSTPHPADYSSLLPEVNSTERNFATLAVTSSIPQAKDYPSPPYEGTATSSQISSGLELLPSTPAKKKKTGTGKAVDALKKASSISLSVLPL